MARRWKDQAAFQAILQEIETLENDRAAAIVAVAMVEYALQLAIEAHDPASKKLFDDRRTLNDFYKKIEFATAKVIDKKANKPHPQGNTERICS